MKKKNRKTSSENALVSAYQQLDVRCRRILAFCVFWNVELYSSRLLPLVAHDKTLKWDQGQIDLILDTLLQKGWLVHAEGKQCCYELAHPLPHVVNEAICQEGTQSDWWPTFEAPGTTPSRDLFPELHRPQYHYLSSRPSANMLISEGLRCFITGTWTLASSDFRNRVVTNAGREIVHAVSYLAIQRFAEEPVLHLKPSDPLLEMLPCYLNLAFLVGRCVTGIITELNRLMDTPKFVPTDELLCSYCACCIWMGRDDFLDITVSKKQENLLRAFQLIAEYDFKGADAFFKRENLFVEGKPYYAERDVDNLVVRTLLAMVCARTSSSKLPKQRPYELLKGNCAYLNIPNGMRITETYLQHMRNLSSFGGEAWHNICTNPGHLLKNYEEVFSFTHFYEGLLLAWDYYVTNIGRTLYVQQFNKLWTLCKQAAQMEWWTLARFYAALLVGGYDVNAERPFLNDLDEQGMQLLPRVTPVPEWYGMLHVLEKVIPKSIREKRQGDENNRERFLWCVSFARNEKGELRMDSCTPVLRPRYGNEDGRDDTFLNVYDLERKRIYNLMSDHDKLIAIARYPKSYASIPRIGDVCSLLCNVTNVIECPSDKSVQYQHRRTCNPDVSHPITFERQPCTMESCVGEDGGLVLKIAPELLHAKEGYCLRDLGNARYAFIEISQEINNILTVFRTPGCNGKLTIPREGLAYAEPIFNELTKILPLSEPSAEQAESLKRIPAASVVRLRLDFSNMVFTVRAVVLPLPDNANLVFDPGYGPAEKMVANVAGVCILVRDLAAEKKFFEVIHTVLAEEESFFDGKSEWRFDDLATAITVLDKIKNLDAAIVREWVNDRRLSVSTLPISAVKLTSKRTADDWFHVDGTFELDDGRVLSVVKMLEAAGERVGNYVKLAEGDYVALNKTIIRQLDALSAAGRRKGDGVELVKAAIPLLDHAFGNAADSIQLPNALSVTAAEIRAAFKKRPDVPSTLNAELRPYQQEGYLWLSRLAACGFGACLADDMGLGKTIQIITLLLERAQDGASLVVAPSSVCGNWRRELERFAPTLHPIMVMEAEGALKNLAPNDVAIVSYGYMLFHAEDFSAITWNGLVLDEAQAIKNDASKRAKTVKSFHAKFRVAATGTPIENRLGELWSLFDFLNPGLLGAANSFTQRFTFDGKAIPTLKRLVKPLILRRLKGDVLDDLPEKTEVTIPIVLGKEERAAYEGCRQFALARLEEKAEENGAANRMSILAELTRLRRFCCHPSLALQDKSIPSAKMEALVDLLDGLHESHHRALVFSQFTDYLALVRTMITSHGWSHLYLDGSTPTLEREKLVNAFQNGEGEFFLISLKAGGTGLNLTAANYVVLLDPWWNPAVENQAADRAHRIGQKNPVTVYRLIASDTVEARVIKLHHEKLAIAEDVLEGTASTALSPAQLMKLFA